MIPLRLRLKNFLGYRDNQELSLEGIQLACLSGENGAGKSALLDAMTWALWGQARGRTADDLVHLGQMEMEVELEFAVVTDTLNGGRQRYRALRKHSRNTPGHPSQTILELQAAGGRSEERKVAGENPIPPPTSHLSPLTWQPVTGNSLRDTQRQIIDILHLDYDTFINSAFLLQGRADEFTIKPPAKRKELLAEILGLSFYEELERRAREKRKNSETQVRILDSAIEKIEEELARRPTYETELQQVQSALAEIEPKLRSQEATLASLRQKQGELEAKSEELKTVSYNLSQAQKEMETIQSQQGEHQRRIVQYEALLGQRQSIDEGYSQLQLARKENELWNEKLMSLNALQQRQNQLERIIQAAKAALDTDVSVLKRQVIEQNAKAQALPQLQQDLSQAQASLSALLAEETALKQKRLTIQEMRDQINGLRSAHSQMETEIASLKEKLGLLAKGDAHCPLCETELGVEGRQRLEAKYRHQIQSGSEALNANQKQIEKNQREYLALARGIEDGETRLKREMATAHSRIAAVEKDLNQAQLAQATLSAEQDKFVNMESRLVQKEYAQAEQSQLGTVLAEIAALDYNQVKHQEGKKHLATLEPFEGKKRQLDEAEIRIQSERLALSHSMEALAQIQDRWQGLEQKKLALMGEVASVPELAAKLHQTDELYKSLRAQERSQRDKSAALLSHLERCHALETTKNEKQALRAEAAREEGIYKELAEAFGKKGVPALLIEAALPELETETNRLLSRMTDNRMFIKLESQREHRDRKGEPIETLDIKVSDELGTRDYEMFSGGEAFRINLALRIALSKLLAHRAGAPLPILVIDEGFGTQDNAGREKLVEAINSIQGDFEKILVITHIEELKDLFPVRIEVTKTNEGSTFRIVE